MSAGLSPAWMRLRDHAMHKLGVGQTRGMRSVITGIFLPIWGMRAYTVMDKINVWRGKLTEFELPIDFLSGRHDHTVNANLSRAYFNAIRAPAKGFYLFQNSAHSPLFEEPDRATGILVHDVLEGRNSPADG